MQKLAEKLLKIVTVHLCICVTIGLHKAVVPHVHTSTSAASYTYI